MPKSIRIRTNLGVDRQINVDLSQDFEFLEILSLKLSQSELYVRRCSDYGVVVGRVSVNDGFGIPNAKLSLFIPITAEDELNPIVSSIYPYKTITDVNEDGYKYNLLPYKPSYPGHVATGSFPDLEDVLINPAAIELYDKYYKFTVTTNDSGDFMIFGVPTGSHTLVMNVDLSDIGPFSLSPQDLIRAGIATESQVNGTKFKSSETLSTLPQIIIINKQIEVLPLWGEDDLCQASIVRTDFDLTNEANIEIKPTAIFMGSIFSDSDRGAIRKKCKPPLRAGAMCSLISGPGQIRSIRQTIAIDNSGRPVLEQHEFENDGNVIDENGTWLLDVPMNLDYIITNEFGEQVFSNDQRKGVPTKAKYRFKIKWNQTPDLSTPIKRGSFLVPNVKEHGWVSASSDPTKLSYFTNDYQMLKSSYAYSLDWNDYGYSGLTTQGLNMIQDAIDCKDMFYEMSYNKVYTISQLITRYTKGTLNRRFSAIKNITDDECESTSNKFPANDAQFKPDLLFIAFTVLLTFLTVVIKIIVRIFHILARVLQDIIDLLQKIHDKTPVNLNGPISKIKKILEGITNIGLPLYTFPDCELCSCTDTTNPGVSGGINSFSQQAAFANNSVLADVVDAGAWNYSDSNPENDFSSIFQQGFAGSQLTNTSLSFGFRAPIPVYYNYDPGGVPVAVGTISVPTHEMINLFNTRAKFFGSGVNRNYIDINDESSINIQGDYYLGGGVNQIKVCFNSDRNNLNNGLDLNPNMSFAQTPLLTNITATNNGYHYDNVVIILTEDRYEKGQLLTFENPTKFNDLNLTGQTVNQYGTYSITGTPVTGVTNISVSHTHPMTGKRLITNYDIAQSGETQDNFLRYPTDIEYFQVVESILVRDFIFSGTQAPMYQFSLSARIFDPWSQFWLQNRGPGGTLNWEWSYGGNLAWDYFEEKNSTYITILMRGVDPHSTPQPMKIGLGRIFGQNNHWGYLVEGNFKLNIPLQPNDGLDFGDPPNQLSQTTAASFATRCTRHDQIINNDLTSFSNYTQGGRLFYKSYHFKPTSSDWTTFDTTSPRNYINSYDNDASLQLLGSEASLTNYPYIRRNYNAYMTGAGTIGLRIGVNNFFTRRGSGAGLIQPTSSSNTYIPGESVEGSSFMMLGGGNLDEDTNYYTLSEIRIQRLTPIYHSRKYDDTLFSMSDSERIVMRSDRLPTSDVFQTFGSNSMGLMANGNFQIYEIPEEGIVNLGFTASIPTFTINEPESIETPVGERESPVTKLLETFSCGSLVPVNCYGSSNDTVTVQSTGTCTYVTYSDRTSYTTQFFTQGSCYSLVRPPYNLKANVKNDLELVNEWYSRMNINFGACREVFSHLFVNNWVNGSLYMFPFKNSRYFTGINANPPNQPYNKFCGDNVYMHPETFNIYYRSAPFKDSSVSFIGRGGTGDGNEENLMYPTTIMDLGPRNELQKFLSQSGNWDGYIMNKLESTTFGDTSDLLNLFILSRLANTSFTTFFKSRSSSVLNFFNSRKKKFVDADFAQMVATNSQFGIAAYDPESYPEPLSGTSHNSENSPLFFPQVSADDDVVFGIFYTGDSQSRDYISPNRIIYNQNGNITDLCAFSYIPVTTQEVPFYLWDIVPNPTRQNIFGTQKNDWKKGNGYSYKYQGLDRFLPYSVDTPIFQPSLNVNEINYHKGWIYNVDLSVINSGTGEADYDPYTPLPNGYNFGAPYYFYFGLTKGASAFDRFTTKWIDTDELVN